MFIKNLFGNQKGPGDFHGKPIGPHKIDREEIERISNRIKDTEVIGLGEEECNKKLYYSIIF